MSTDIKSQQLNIKWLVIRKPSGFAKSIFGYLTSMTH